ncbi:MAG: mannose-6-phosphate isomerase, class I [Treponema sp.]|jgi:mannose-6-phosphate isomerase|nr:mannose-6-phosphate isomerase, class I [Treponema sp.]
MTNKIYKLQNQIKNYEWGSIEVMPEFLGIENTKNIPFAEMWMGTHENAPSLADLSLAGNNEADQIPLKEISGDLSFLFKLLAVEKPLSIQAHPDRDKAAEGFRMEEEAGINLRSPTRNYKDPNHKPELLCAISRFSLMAGFKELDMISKSLNEFLLVFPQLKEVISTLQRSLNTESLAVFLRILFNLSKFEKEYMCDLITKKDNIKNSDIIIPEQWALIKAFASQYPEDPAILSPLYLNYLTLQPGQVIYLPPGILHSYINGFGIELMTSSDNVLRGGLTPKYIDIPELMNILNFTPYNPKIHSPAFSSWHCYRGENYSLVIMEGDGNKKVFPGKGPAICLVTDGELNAEGLTFKKGESFFIPKSSEELVLNGKYSAFFAQETCTASSASSDFTDI